MRCNSVCPTAGTTARRRGAMGRSSRTVHEEGLEPPPSVYPHRCCCGSKDLIFSRGSIMQQAVRGSRDRPDIHDMAQEAAGRERTTSYTQEPTLGYTPEGTCYKRPTSLPLSHLNHNLNLPFEGVSHPYASSLKQEVAARYDIGSSRYRAKEVSGGVASCELQTFRFSRRKSFGRFQCENMRVHSGGGNRNFRPIRVLLSLESADQTRSTSSQRRLQFAVCRRHCTVSEEGLSEQPAQKASAKHAELIGFGGVLSPPFPRLADLLRARIIFFRSS